MLASITPLGERSRRQRWRITVAAHAAGGALGGALTGLALAGAGELLPAGDRTRAAALAGLLLVGALLDLGSRRLRLSHRRQVDELWLRRYRGWVYGAGFGLQLGSGFATVVATAAVYGVLAGCLLAPSLAWGCAIGAAFGLCRGATPIVTARVTDPARLRRFHGRMTALQARAHRSTVVAQSALAVAALALAWRL